MTGCWRLQSPVGIFHPLAEAGTTRSSGDAPRGAAAVLLESLAAVFCRRRKDVSLNVGESLQHIPVEGGLISGGNDRDYGPRQDQAVEQAWKGCDLVTLGCA